MVSYERMHEAKLIPLQGRGVCQLYSHAGWVHGANNAKAFSSQNLDLVPVFVPWIKKDYEGSKQICNRIIGTSASLE